LKQFKVIALTHRNLGLELVGKFHIEPDLQAERLIEPLKEFQVKESVFLSTCNRVEFFLRTERVVDTDFVSGLIQRIYPELTHDERVKALDEVRIYTGLDAIRHLFHVSSSLDSLVVGEREIITQVRGAFEMATKNGLSGDFWRIAFQKAIETAKQVYTETEIATKPVSVVNLAYRKLLERDINNQMNVVMVGAGQTNEALAGNLKTHSFQSFKVFNRTFEKARTLASAIGGEAHSLNDLASQAGDFDVMLTCTGADRAIIDSETFAKMKNGNKRPIIVDLAIPNDIDASVLTHFDIDYISIEDLKEEAKRNLKFREAEIFRCEALVEQRLVEFEDAFKTRKLELAMKNVPEMMKEIKHRAIDKTFARDIDDMDDESREKLLKIIDYLEKKYIAIPMKMAKQVVLGQDLKDPIIDE